MGGRARASKRFGFVRGACSAAPATGRGGRRRGHLHAEWPVGFAATLGGRFRRGGAAPGAAARGRRGGQEKGAGERVLEESDQEIGGCRLSHVATGRIHASSHGYVFFVLLCPLY